MGPAAAAAGAAAGGGVWWPLLLSTLAGLSTSIGGLIAIHLPHDESTLAFLLGSAVGVMSTVSIAELWWHKALAHGWLGITTAVAAGGVLFAVLDPLLPKPVEPLQEKDSFQEEPLLVKVHLDSQPQVTVATSVKRQRDFAPRQVGLKLATAADTPGTFISNSSSSIPASSPKAAAATAAAAAASQTAGSNGSSAAPKPAAAPAELGVSASHLHPRGFSSDTGGHQHQQHQQHHQQADGVSPAGSGSGSIQGQLQVLRAHHAGLMRLGLLMALTMTLHNLPEGFAVAFSAFTSVGPLMCLAIGAHNISEGLIIAAPIYAATGSKARAMAIATLSGLSEPLGACVALFVFRPFVNSIERLDYVLAFVGGIMLAVCVLELWPEGRKCRQDVRLVQGMVVGSVLMGWTLYAGV